MRTTINNQDIEVVIIAADGSELTEALQSGELILLAKMDAALKAHKGFIKACPEARLVRVDSNRGLGNRDDGRFYLRYQHTGGMAEFWGKAADVPLVDIETGTVGVAG